MDVLDHIGAVFADFANPARRIFVGYLLWCVLLALVWFVFFKRMAIRAAWRRLFDRRVFFSDSAKADYKIFVINQIIAMFLSPVLITQLIIASGVYYTLLSIGFFQEGVFRDTEKAVVVALYSAFVFLFDDFTRYLVHRLMHTWPIFWAMHKTHHSATTLTPVTVYRIHPLELILYGTRGTVAHGISLSIFLFMFGNTVDIYTVFGANILIFFFHVTGSNLRHSHVDIHYWPWLERILMSPAQHQLHHSVAEEHYDKNYGSALSVWDWMFGSLHLSEPGKELTFGLDASQKADHSNLRAIYLQPIVEIWSIVTGAFKSVSVSKSESRSDET